MTPVDVDTLEDLLTNLHYPKDKTKFLTHSFRNGFDLGYRGDPKVKLKSPNLKITVGSKIILWNKVMKEVQLKRYAGPFSEPPFEHFIQSPIGLVPKDGNKTRLIFHLSYPRGSGKSVNENTPEHLCSVKYKDFDEAVKLCARLGKNCSAGKSDMTSAFRHLCIRKRDWKYLVMKAQNPSDGKFYYFVDKCLPFGSAISCAHFQAFSDAVAFVVSCLTQEDNVNYLDDFFFAALYKAMCDSYIEVFLKVCEQINFPVSLEKTFWGATTIIFLGLLIDTELQLVCIPEEKVNRALEMIKFFLSRRKVTLKQLQKLCGFLNFLCKSVVPGRVFTRRLYAFGSGLTKPNHHLNVNSEMRMDLRMWEQFLSHPSAYSRPFFDFSKELNSEEIDMFTDASRNPRLGCGGFNKDSWFMAQWDLEFMNQYNPSINYLELYAVAVAVLNWIHRYPNKRVTLFCDNLSVVHMINNTASNCKNCMLLLRIIVLKGLIHNVHIRAKHVVGVSNNLADFLSRMKKDKFLRLARKQRKIFSRSPTPMPSQIWPMQNIWLN